MINFSRERIINETNRYKAYLADRLDSPDNKENFSAQSHYETIVSQYNEKIQAIDTRSEKVFKWVQRYVGNVFAFIAFILIYFEIYLWYDFILSLTWLAYVLWLYFFVGKQLKEFKENTSFMKHIINEIKKSKPREIELIEKSIDDLSKKTDEAIKLKKSENIESETKEVKIEPSNSVKIPITLVPTSPLPKPKPKNGNNGLPTTPKPHQNGTTTGTKKKKP